MRPPPLSAKEECNEGNNADRGHLGLIDLVTAKASVTKPLHFTKLIDSLYKVLIHYIKNPKKLFSIKVQMNNHAPPYGRLFLNVNQPYILFLLPII